MSSLIEDIIIVGFVMICVASTNHFAVQFTNLVSHWINWPMHISYTANDSSDFSKNRPHPNSKIVSTKENSASPQAFVILGSVRHKGALERLSEYQEQDIYPSSMERLRYGASLARQTKLPILVSVGAPDKASKQKLSEAFMVKLVLE
jgi:hypothetical protein